MLHCIVYDTVLQHASQDASVIGGYMMPCSNMYYVPRCDRVDDCLCCFKSVSRYAVFHLERERYGWEKRRRGRDMDGRRGGVGER